MEGYITVLTLFTVFPAVDGNTGNGLKLENIGYFFQGPNRCLEKIGKNNQSIVVSSPNYNSFDSIFF